MANPRPVSGHHQLNRRQNQALEQAIASRRGRCRRRSLGQRQQHSHFVAAMEFRAVDALLPYLRRDAPAVHNLETQALEKARAQRQRSDLFEATRQGQIKQFAHQQAAQTVAVLARIHSQRAHFG